MFLPLGPDQLHLDDRNTGRPLVAVHSSGLAGLQWRQLASRLSTTHRTLALDLLGYGRSTPFDESRRVGFDFRTDVAAVEAACGFVGAPVDLVGHSYGALLALCAAIGGRVPVRTLTLCEPVAFSLLTEVGLTADWDALRALDAGSAFFSLDAGYDGWMRGFVDWWQGAGAWDALPAPSRQAMLRSAPKTWAEVFSLMTHVMDADAVRRLDVPTLLIHGSRSPAPAIGVCRAIGTLVKGARVEAIEGAGHMAPISHARLVNERIAAHVA